MITLEEQIAEARRELALRKKCYPNFVERGKLDADEAQYQIKAQYAILRTLIDLNVQQQQLPLFDDTVRHP